MFSLGYIHDVGVRREKKVRLIIRKIIFEEFQRVSSQSTQRYRQTDKQTDGQFTMTIGPSALRYASRDKNTTSVTKS